ncbi:kinesin-like protein Klp5 [Scheffersomyces spartinae]|uniref:Kinesin-like protein n=1 Tax=Scheffersomyces spartinae TaxID=45513 RepID=A0A9P8AIR8_9ASCO|nr:kinesin-like protein Klp5 [Scheffersomyces spartinae]KAG7193411.1 kinesin-like protein Klp5 [Scheffersomyces spartinae]
MSTPSIPSSGSGARQSSITVAVRVRPFTILEEQKLVAADEGSAFFGDGSLSNNTNTLAAANANTYAQGGLRKIIEVVDDKMLIFDPSRTNPLARMQQNAFPNTKTRIREHRFVFDRLFDTTTPQEDVYNATTRPLLDSILEGFNATVFAYGATGCGKTHTILGTENDPGIIFLTMKELYERIDELRNDRVFEVTLSYLEIYNETIRDLLQPETEHRRLILREDSNNRISVSNLLCVQPQSVEEVMNLILQGNANRTSSPTEANATSSRSHAVLQINIMQRPKTADIVESHTYATLSIIDLAGSERAAATRNRGIRLNEGANINKSLLALGNCINALCDPRRRNHVPYRDSKLTRLLKFSLGGNCKTVMIVCVSPSSHHYDETLNTLKYANRAKEIKTKVIRNQQNLDRHVGSYLKMITEQKMEILDLKLRESRIVEEELQKQNNINEKCINELRLLITNIQRSIESQTQDKWRRYFVLAKRKILFTHKVGTESLIESLQESDDANAVPEYDFFLNKCHELLQKLEGQIAQLEAQYSEPNQLDHILDKSANQVLKKLKEMEGWNEGHTSLFQDSIELLNDYVLKDILLNSSVLSDYLAKELTEFQYIHKNFISVIKSADPKVALQSITNSIQNILDGELDSALESLTSEFMQQKVNPETTIPNLDNVLNNNPSSFIPRQRQVSGSKRSFDSPLKVSPPAKKKFAPIDHMLAGYSERTLAIPKKVRWDANVPSSDVGSIADLSMDEQQFRSEDDASILIDDKLLDSPNSSILHDDSTPAHGLSGTLGNNSLFFNRRLSMSLSENSGDGKTHDTTRSIRTPQLNVGAASTKLLIVDGEGSQ